MSDETPRAAAPDSGPLPRPDLPGAETADRGRTGDFGTTGTFREVPAQAYDGGYDGDDAAAAEQWGALSDCFLTILTRPRETIRRIVSVNPRYWVFALAALAGTSATLSPMPGISEARTGMLFLLLLSVTAAPVFGIVFLWIGAWIVRALGHALLGGRATPEEVRAALAWANVPKVATLPVGLIASMLMRGGLQHAGAAPLALALGLLTLVSFASTVWGTFIACQTVAEVQGYRSAWRGLLNLLLPFLVLGAIGTFLAILVPFAIRR